MVRQTQCRFSIFSLVRRIKYIDCLESPTGMIQTAKCNRIVWVEKDLWLYFVHFLCYQKEDQLLNDTRSVYPIFTQFCRTETGETVFHTNTIKVNKDMENTHRNKDKSKNYNSKESC